MIGCLGVARTGLSGVEWGHHPLHFLISYVAGTVQVPGFCSAFAPVRFDYNHCIFVRGGLAYIHHLPIGLYFYYYHSSLFTIFVLDFISYLIIGLNNGCISPAFQAINFFRWSRSILPIHFVHTTAARQVDGGEGGGRWGC